MEPMAAVYAAYAAPAYTADVTSAESEAADVTSAKAAIDMTSAEAVATETAMTTPATPTAHQYEQTATCSQIGVVGIARLRERCRGRKCKRKSADDTKRDDAAFKREYAAFHDLHHSWM